MNNKKSGFCHKTSSKTYRRFQASLVCLSACETGTGHLESGEGLLSMARSFAYAGAKSLVAGLWQVSENASSDIFQSFYRRLDAGQSRAFALRDAKTDWLRSPAPDARKAPFYWAGLTLYGQDGAVPLQRDTAPLWPWILAAAIVAAIAYFRLTGRYYIGGNK